MLKKYCLFAILVAIYISSSVGVFSLLYLECHRNSFQSGVSEMSGSIIKVSFSKNEFANIRWEEKFKEFEFDGKLFDVSKIERTKEGFAIYCVNDTEEESIVTLFKEWKKSNWPVVKSKIQLQPLFFPNSFIEVGLQDAGELISYCAPKENYNSERTKIPSPPPR